LLEISFEYLDMNLKEYIKKYAVQK